MICEHYERVDLPPHESLGLFAMYVRKGGPDSTAHSSGGSGHVAEQPPGDLMNTGDDPGGGNGGTGKERPEDRNDSRDGNSDAAEGSPEDWMEMYVDLSPDSSV